MSINTETFTMTAAMAHPAERADFIRRTYLHLAGAIIAFIGLEKILLQSALSGFMMDMLMSSQYSWLMILGGFILVSWLARGFAANVASQAIQYGGLALFVIAEAVIFVPIIHIAVSYSSPSVLPNAVYLTLALFLGLTATVFITKKDFSILGSILTLGGFVALGLIVCSVIFGFSLGLVFSGVMVLVASGAILYDTSKILHQFETDQHVAAALELFASVALLFWYVLQIFMSED